MCQNDLVRVQSKNLRQVLMNARPSMFILNEEVPYVHMLEDGTLSLSFFKKNTKYFLLTLFIFDHYDLNSFNVSNILHLESGVCVQLHLIFKKKVQQDQKCSYLCSLLRWSTNTARSVQNPDKIPREVLGLTTTFESKPLTRPKGALVTGSPYSASGMGTDALVRLRW